MTKMSIITPCYNAEEYIARTIESVIYQTAVISGRVDLEYIICDGGSTDNTINIVKNFKSNVITLISEPDNGMYDALAKGLKIISGDICAYINADDFYSNTAFDVVLDIFENNNIKWITGLRVAYNEMGQFVGVLLPYKYRKRFFENGFYGKKLPFVQQESTFWKAELNKLVNLSTLANFKYAGDFYLWYQFSKTEKLIIIEAYLGGFRRNKGQLSENMDSYLAEMNTIVQKPSILDYLLLYVDYLIWGFGHAAIKKFLNKKGLLRFNHDFQNWY